MAAVVITGGQAAAAALAALAERTGSASSLKVGFLEGATYPDGTSVPFVAAMNEFGTATSPPRPFFRNMVAEKSPGWGKALGRIAAANGYDMEKTLALMGEGIRGQLQKSIQMFDSVPLAKSTIKSKGFEKQLIDTSVMVNSVDYEVEP